MENFDDNQLNIALAVESEVVDSDDASKARFSVAKESSWLKNAEQYNKLLKNYVTNAKENLEMKKKQKNWFFGISMFILVVAIGVSLGLMWMILVKDSTTELLEILPVLLTFLTPLLTIPNIIAKYLFTNTDEEHMIKIVTQIIEHDDNSLS